MANLNEGALNKNQILSDPAFKAANLTRVGQPSRINLASLFDTPLLPREGQAKIVVVKPHQSARAKSTTTVLPPVLCRVA